VKISSRLLSSLLVTALIPLVCVAVVVYVSSRATLLRVAKENLDFHATTMGNTVKEIIERSFEEVESWSKLDTLQMVFTGDDTDLRMGLTLRDLTEASDFTQIWCVDTTGKIVASNSFDDVGKNVNTEPALQAALEDRYYISEVRHLNSADNTTPLTIAMSRPIIGAFDEETVIGAIIAFYDWNGVVSVVENQEVTHDRNDQLVLLLSSQGIVIAAADERLVLEKHLPISPGENPQTGASISQALGEFENSALHVITGTAQVDLDRLGVHYTVLAAVDRRVVIQWLSTLEFIIVLVSVLAVAGVVLLSISLTRKISIPIVGLSRAARQIAEGNLEVCPEYGSTDEIGRLARDLDSMRFNLKSHIETLDTTVRDRTQELEITISQLRKEISDREEAERQTNMHKQQLVQADKMVSLGILVSGVAHEINNPNALIGLNTQVIAEAWAKALPVLEEYFQDHGDFSLGALNYSEMRSHIPKLLEELHEGSMRIKTIVRDLKAFSNKDVEIVFDNVDVNSVVESAIGLVMKHLEKCTTDFSVHCDADVPEIPGVFHRLEQVIVNLLLNACDAVQNREQGIRVATSFDPAAGVVQIEVRDEGSGIDAENIQHVTDPFFTTKRSEGGTGLGLSVSSGIIEDHGGTLTFQSTAGIGTTVILTLPAQPNREIPVK